MKTLALFTALALGFGQSLFVYSDSNGDLSLRSKEGKGKILTEGAKRNLQLDLKGAVQVNSRRQKFVLNADGVQALAVPGKNSKSPNEIRSATATGNVTFAQTAGQRSSTIRCASAVYTASEDAAKLDARGSVRIQSFDEGKKQRLMATGGSGTAVLDKSASEGAGLREATLTGSVRVEIVDAATKGAQAVFTGDRLTLTQKQITLSGHVKAVGKGTERFGNLSGVQTLTIDLNQNKEMTGFSFKSGGGR